MKLNIGVAFLAHNRRQLTLKSLETLVRQTFVVGVIVDNASRDGTGEELEKKVADDARLSLIRNSINRYPGAARNQMVEELARRVDVIVFMDNDIMINSPKCFEALSKAFQATPNLGQISPLAAPDDFLLGCFVSGGQRLASTISNATSAITAIRTEPLLRGLRWREIRWHPVDNQEIGEDYFMSRDLQALGYSFAWFAADNPHCCENAGRGPVELVADLPYYLRTFAERGMLSRLSQALPERASEVEAYARHHGVPELHGSFNLEDTPAASHAMTLEEADLYSRQVGALLPELRQLINGISTNRERLRALCERSRDYFDGLPETHPLFSQRSLQAAISFNRMVRKLDREEVKNA